MRILCGNLVTTSAAAGAATSAAARLACAGGATGLLLVAACFEAAIVGLAFRAGLGEHGGACSKGTCLIGRCLSGCLGHGFCNVAHYCVAKICR